MHEFTALKYIAETKERPRNIAQLVTGETSSDMSGTHVSGDTNGNVSSIMRGDSSSNVNAVRKTSSEMN